MNTAKDGVAIVGLGATGYSRGGDGNTMSILACRAAVDAIRDAGLTAADIDGVVASHIPGSPPAHEMVSLLGLGDVTYFTDGSHVMLDPIVTAIGALCTGQCTTVLVYHANLQSPYASRQAALDPFRRTAPLPPRDPPEAVRNAAAYAGWASRYLHQYGVGRHGLGMVAVNSRTNASRNPLAVKRTPFDLDKYFAARMIREPLCLLDMDIPVDGADAIVLTTADRATDLRQPRVLIHAATVGTFGGNAEEQLPSLQHHGHHVVAAALRRRSDIALTDVDVLLAYDGFTIITLSWLESLGWCGPGEATGFLDEHWDAEANRVLIKGRIPLNTHGGSLSEGATQGSGHLREAVVQLRGGAGERQVPDAETAVVATGGFFFNSQGAVLRRG